MSESLRSRVTLRPDAVAFEETGPLPSHQTYARDYQTQDLLGEGGMGRVIAARDQILHRRVAIKELRTEVRHRPDLWSRFIREAQIGGQLEHPNIVPIYGFQFSPAGGPAFVMQLVDGESLADSIERSRNRILAGETGVPSLKERVSLLLPVCDAIAYAHGRGVLHRDLKPDNVMIGAHNVVLVTDWGIARVESDELTDENGGAPEQSIVLQPEDLGAARTVATAPLEHQPGTTTTNSKTEVGSVLGTPEYMSPEQALGIAVERSSDQYSLGLMLFELASLCPARSRDGSAYSQALMSQQGPHVDLTGAPLDPRLSAIISRATQKEITARYASVEAFAHDLRAFVRDEEVSVLPDSLARKFLRHSQKHPVRSVATGSFLLLALAGWALMSTSRAAKQAVSAREDAQALSQLSSAVVGEGRSIERYVLKMDGELIGLGQTVRVRVSDERPLAGPRPLVLEPSDIEKASGPGFVQNSVDGTIRSYQEPVFVFAPGADALARVQADRIASAKADLIDVYLDGIGESTDQLSEAEQQALMAANQRGIVRLMIALESGVFVQFPGRSGFDRGYDARRLDWYKEASRAPGSTLLRPKYGPLGRIPRMAITRSLEVHGRPIGVVAAGFWLEPFVALLGTHGMPGLKTAFLAAPDGKEIASRHLLEIATHGAPEAPVSLPDVSSRALREALREKAATGYLIDGESLFVLTRLAVEDWVLVHEYPKARYLRLVR